jgi:hypothetical protein
MKRQQGEQMLCEQQASLLLKAFLKMKLPIQIGLG